MSSKSRKYRKPNIAAATVAASSGASVQNNSVAKPAAKSVTSAIPVPTAQSFLQDLSWIGLTTLIVVIIMVIAYFVVPR